MASDGRPDGHAELRRHHPKLRYLYLKAGIAVLRGFGGLGSSISIKRQERKVPKTIVRTLLHVPSREEGRTIKLVLHEPLPGDEPAGHKKLLPAHINIHGSGFCMEALGADCDFCCRLVNATGTAVYDMTHRMAPEHPFPAAYEDVEDVLDHIRGQPETYDLDRITIGGFSAGGNLALAVANTYPDRVRAMVGFYISTDLTVIVDPPTKQHDKGVEIPTFIRRFFYRCYAVDRESLKDIRASPLFAPTSTFPKRIFLACGRGDSLHNAAQTLIERLRKEGHPDATFLSIENEAHAFDKEAPDGSVSAKRKAQMYDGAIETIKRALADADASSASA